MAKGKILYVNQEVAPFSPESEMAQFNYKLASTIQSKGRDIRLFMPRFSFINERKHQLHEVIRLCGMNLIINGADHQLLIKVASIPQARMQVYFIDNTEYFTTKEGVFDEEGNFYEQNDERILFYSHGALEAVRQLSWQPHIIHYSGWFACMIPFYLRRANKENEFFKNTKTVISITDDLFEGVYPSNLERNLKADGATAKDLRLYDKMDYRTLIKAAIAYSSGVVIATPNVDPEILKAAKAKRFCLPYNPNQAEFILQINSFYEQIAGKKNLNESGEQELFGKK